jgi:predicted HTH domain antitoxin
MAVLQLDLSDHLIAALNDTEVEAMREAALVKLYDLGRISSGKAARVLGVSRRVFLDVLGRYGVSEFDDTMDVAAEARIG